jgi:hypothetical protein
MPRRLPEEFEGKELVPLCLASKLADAKEIESVLDKASYSGELEKVSCFLFFQGSMSFVEVC